MRVDRIATLCVLLLSLAMLFVVIPSGAEHIGNGALSPDGLPRALAWIMTALAAIQLFNPFERAPDEAPDGRGIAMAMVALAFLAGCVWLIGLVGFLPSTIVLATGACLMMRERRWMVVACSGLLVPASVWLVVTQILDRTLP